MNTDLNRRRFLLAALGLLVVVHPNVAFAKDGDDNDESDNSGSGSSGSDDDSDDDNSGSGSSGSGRDDNNDDDNSGSGSSGSGSNDDDDDNNSSGGSGSNSGSGGGSSFGGQGRGRGRGKSNARRSQNEISNAANAVKSGKAVSLRKLMSHVKANYGGKVLDVKLNRGLFRYSYRVKHLGSNGRLQTLRLDALSLKKL
jgi:uncharacterized membrane protein YkoI